MFGPEDEKNYTDMIKDGWEMTADGFWFKETPSENYTTTISDNPKLGCYKQTYADGSVRYTMTEEPNDYLFNLNMQSEDKIDLNLDTTNKNGFWKYEEDKTLKEVKDYIAGTYKGHYTSQESKTQTLDLIESIGDGEPFSRSNAIKYLSRFGKKHGKSKLDLMKAIHYCILLYHFAGLHNETKGTYETF